jgi:hypothetical protein
MSELGFTGFMKFWFAGNCCRLRFIDFQGMFAGFTGCSFVNLSFLLKGHDIPKR